MNRSIALALVSIALAGCVQPGSTVTPSAQTDSAWSEPLRLEDAVGDAHDLGASSLARNALATFCGGLPCPEAPALDDAAPWFDISGVSFDGETADTILLSLEVAGIAEGFAQLDAPMHRSAMYSACFAPATDAVERCAIAEVYRHGDEAIVFGYLSHDDESCNEWGWCAYAIPVTVEWGEPATFRFEVPKALAFRGAEPARVETMSAQVVWTMYNPASPAWHAAYTAHGGPVGHGHKHVVPPEYSDMPDVLEAQPIGRDVTPSTVLPAWEGPDLVAAPGNYYGDDSQFDVPEMDLLDLDLFEEDGNLVMRMTLAGMSEKPDFAIQHMLIFGIEGKDTYEMGWLQEGGKQYGYAGHCISYECMGSHMDGPLAEHDATGHKVVEAPFELEPGSPAVLTVRAPLSAFPRIVEGDRTNLVWMVTQYADAAYYWGSYGTEDHGDLHKMSFVDHRLGGSVHTFTQGNAEDAGAHEH